MVIFLDIDGVLNKEIQWKHMFTLDKACVDNFCKFASGIHANIVLTSTWKNGFISSLNENNSKPIKQLELFMQEYDLKIIGCTPSLTGRTRDKEIERYIYLNNINHYIVIDDDKTLFQNTNQYYYFTNSITGFTKEDIRKCRKCI